MVRDKAGQMFLGDFLRAYCGTPIMTEGNLPGGGRLFETCTREVEVAEQARLFEEGQGDGD